MQHILHVSYLKKYRVFQIHIQIHSLKFMFQQNELEYHLKKRKHPVIYIIKYLEYYRIKM